MTNLTFDLNATLGKLSGSEKEAQVALMELYSRFAHDIIHLIRKYFKSDALALGVVAAVYTEIWRERKALMNAADFESYFFEVIERKVFEVVGGAVGEQVN